MLLTAFHGFCMALADSVPGVSGGTVAFILGFYDQLLDALHGLFGRNTAARKPAAAYLLRLGAGWGLGMIVCIILLSSLFEKHIYFISSLFLGLTLTSFPFILRAETPALRGHLQNLPFSLLGLLPVVGLTLLRKAAPDVTIHFSHTPVWMLAYLFFSGGIAISATVLPGISGSTILLIAGVYLPALQAIAAVLHLDFSALPGLCALALGMLTGVCLFIHALRSALRKYRSQMVYLILGLMTGSLYAIVMGPASLDIPQAPLTLKTFHFIGFALGIAALLGLESLRKTMASRQKK